MAIRRSGCAPHFDRVGLGRGPRAEAFRRVEPPSYDPRRDADTHLLNPAGLRAYAINLAMAVTEVMNDGSFRSFSAVIAASCLGQRWHSNRPGARPFVSRRAYGLRDSSLEPYGEAASMDLALVTGAGPAFYPTFSVLAPISTLRLLRFGTRDHLYSDDFIDTPFPTLLQRLDINEVHALRRSRC